MYVKTIEFFIVMIADTINQKIILYVTNEQRTLASRTRMILHMCTRGVNLESQQKILLFKE